MGSLVRGIGEVFGGAGDVVSEVASGATDFFGDAGSDVFGQLGDVGGAVGSSVLDEFPGLSDPSGLVDAYEQGGVTGVALDSFNSQLSDLGIDSSGWFPDPSAMSDSPTGGSGSLQRLPAGVTFQQAGAFGGAAMAAGGFLARMSPTVGAAIVKLSQRLGGATGSIASYGRKTWNALSSWAAKNPGVSLVSTLVSLGLTVEEAAHFIAWGTTQKRRARSRGVSSRDLRTTRRTMRKLNRYVASLRHLCGPVHHRRK